MATTLYCRLNIDETNNAFSHTLHGGTVTVNDTAVQALTLSSSERQLATTIGTGVGSNENLTSITGPTGGFCSSIDGWVSQPLAADVTISGTVTLRACGLESAMAANTTHRLIVRALKPDLTFSANIVNSTLGGADTELTTALAATQWTTTPTSTALQRGDRVVLWRLADDASGVTMASGHTITFKVNGSNANIADSFVQFTENLTFETALPTGTVLYLRDTASDANPGAETEKVLGFSRGASAVSKVVNTAAGPTAPIQWTDGGGGAALGWYSTQLNAATLGGVATVNVRVLESNSLALANGRIQLYITNADGGSPVLWATSYRWVDFGLSEAAIVYTLSGPATSIAAQQRILLRPYIDDGYLDAPLVTGHTATLFYDGPTAGASGDSYLTLPMTVTEFVAGNPLDETSWMAVAWAEEPVTEVWV
jgi:hypothetical protein